MGVASSTFPTGLARDHALPVLDPFTGLLPEGGLRRGRVVSCQGISGPSLAFALVAKAVQAGAWLAVVDLPWLGVEAVHELGVPLDRLVRVDSVGDRGSEAWAELVAAGLDGFEVVITRTPAGARPGVLRRVQTRVQARGTVLVVIGDTPVTADVVLRTSAPVWERAAHGHGHLDARRLHVEASGRRVPQTRRVALWLPAPTGGVTLAATAPVESSPGLRAAG